MPAAPDQTPPPAVPRLARRASGRDGTQQRAPVHTRSEHLVLRPPEANPFFRVPARQPRASPKLNRNAALPAAAQRRPHHPRTATPSGCAWTAPGAGPNRARPGGSPNTVPDPDDEHPGGPGRRRPGHHRCPIVNLLQRRSTPDETINTIRRTNSWGYWRSIGDQKVNGAGSRAADGVDRPASNGGEDEGRAPLVARSMPTAACMSLWAPSRCQLLIVRAGRVQSQVAGSGHPPDDLRLSGAGDRVAAKEQGPQFDGGRCLTVDLLTCQSRRARRLSWR